MENEITTHWDCDFNRRIDSLVSAHCYDPPPKEGTNPFEYAAALTFMTWKKKDIETVEKV